MKQEIINKIKDFLEKLVPGAKKVELSEEQISPSKKDGIPTETIWFKVEVEDPRLFSKNESEIIYAINHLAKKILEKEVSSFDEDQRNNTPFDILVDVNDFQKKRIENIKALAHMMAERARYFKSNIEIDPMSAFERRVVHEFLSEARDIKTESQGLGRGRRVVIKYIGN